MFICNMDAVFSGILNFGCSVLGLVKSFQIVKENIKKLNFKAMPPTPGQVFF
jgi:hypothetical protein